MSNITQMTAAQIADAVRSRQLSAREVTEAFLQNIEANDITNVRAFLRTTPEEARKSAGSLWMLSPPRSWRQSPLPESPLP